MEDCLLLCLSLVLIFTLLVSVFAFKKTKNNHNLPPGSFGWPVIGETIEFFLGKPDKFVLDRMRKYSPDIFKTKIIGEKTVVICGPNGHKFLFSNEQKLFTRYLPRPIQELFVNYKATAPPTPNSSTLAYGEEVKLLRSPGFLRSDALVGYLGKMDSITQQQLQTHWEGKDQLEVFPFAESLTLTLACKFFLGTDNPEKIVRFINHFDDLKTGMHSITLSIPGTVFSKAKKAAAAIRKELKAVVQEKKNEISLKIPMFDILSHMIMSTDSTGKYMPEAEIIDIIMGFLTAGYSTVATVMTFFMKYVGERPEIYKKVFDEQMQIVTSKKAGDPLEWNDIQKMKYSWNVLCEVMRLTPPIQGTFREALTDFTYAGYTIPKGWKVYWTVSSTNMNPEYFLEPEKFDPSRYEEGNTFPPFTFVPFGGGPRMCPGQEYSRLAILTFVHHIVKRFRWELVDPKEKIIGDMMPTPQKGLPVRLYRHQVPVS